MYIGEEGVGKSKETGSFVGQFEWVWLRLWTWTLRKSIPQHSLVLSTDIFSLSNLSDTVTFMSKNFGFPSWIHSRRDRNLQTPKRATSDERPRQVPGSPAGVFQLFKQCNRKKGHYELVFICKTAVKIITITPRVKLTVNVTKRKLKQWVDSFKFLWSFKPNLIAKETDYSSLSRFVSSW